MAAGAGNVAVLATCPTCERPVALTLPFTLGPTQHTPNGPYADILIDQAILERAVTIHFNTCGETP